MSKAPRYIEQDDSLQESIDQEIRVKNGGRIKGVEGGLRMDVFDHDENSEYDFTEDDCSVCELPKHSQNLIIEDMEYEEGNA
jgi:hypothetical protein